MSQTYPRPVAVLDAAIRNVSDSWHAIAAHRDRRNRDMLAALRDVETYERQLAANVTAMDGLLDERDRALHPERYAPEAPLAY